MYSNNLALQMPYGLTAPIGLSDVVERALDRIVEKYLFYQVDPNRSDDKRYAAREFSARVRTEIAQLERQVISCEERKAVEEFGRSLFLDILYRATEPVLPNQLLTRLLLDETDWHFPSRYAASKGLQRLAHEKGLSTYLRESDFSKLEHNGRGVSAERMSETFYLLGLSVLARPYLGSHRLIVQNGTSSLNNDLKQDANVMNNLEATMQRFFVNDLADPLQEPLGILVPLQSYSKPTQLVPVHTWRSKSSMSDSYSKLIEAARDKLAERAGTKLEKIQVHDTESRDILSGKLTLSLDNADCAILTSLLDISAPILENTTCISVRLPTDDSYHAVNGASFFEPIPNDLEKVRQLTATLEDKIKDIHTTGLNILDVFFAHANIAATFARKYQDTIKSTSSDISLFDNNPECIYGPLPMALGLGGIQSFYLFLYLTNRLKNY